MSPPKSALYSLSGPFSTPHSTPVSSNASPTSLRRPSAKTSAVVKSTPPEGTLSFVNAGKRRIRARYESLSTLAYEPTEMYRRWEASNASVRVQCPIGAPPLPSALMLRTTTTGVGADTDAVAGEKGQRKTVVSLEA